MRRATQLWIGGVTVVAVGLISFIYLNQKEQIAEQQQALNQQELVARLLKERNAEDANFRQQEAAIAMQLKSLDAEQAKSAASTSADRASLAASDKASADRQRLESKIQDLKMQQAQRARQTDCMLIKMRIRIAESDQDSGQAKALQDRWNANCTSN